MIEVQGLTKAYGGRKAINNLSFEVKKGEVVGFLGPNGAGKTTTMKIITGFMAATEGSAKVAGFDVFESPIEVKSRLGYLPETPPVYLDMRVQDYLQFVAELKKLDRAHQSSFVDSAIDKTGLGDVRSRLIGNLSKGYRQRVGLAQALLGNPEVLVLDEPSVGLDPRQVAEMRQLLIGLKGEHTIILSTHVLSEVEATCERVIIISQGQIIAEDSIASLKSKMKGNRVLRLRVRRKQAELTKHLNSFEGIHSIDNYQDGLHLMTSGDEDIIEKISTAVVNTGAGLLELSQPKAGLEDVFIQLTGQGFESEVEDV